MTESLHLLLYPTFIHEVHIWPHFTWYWVVWITVWLQLLANYSVFYSQLIFNSSQWAVNKMNPSHLLCSFFTLRGKLPILVILSLVWPCCAAQTSPDAIILSLFPCPWPSWASANTFLGFNIRYYSWQSFLDCCTSHCLFSSIQMYSNAVSEDTGLLHVNVHSSCTITSMVFLTSSTCKVLLPKAQVLLVYKLC